jgi:hypothetical protein
LLDQRHADGFGKLLEDLACLGKGLANNTGVAC